MDSKKKEELLEEICRALNYQQTYEQKVQEAAEFLQEQLPTKPRFALVLGSGLNGLTDLIHESKTIPYKDIPHFPRPTVSGHNGQLHIGEIQGIPIVSMQGRKHYYEVSNQPLNTGILQVVFPVHVFGNIGIEDYITTNAAGGLARGFKVGDLMVIDSHINMIPNPLLGRYQQFKTIDGKPVERFQPMDRAYDPQLRQLLKKAGEEFPDNTHEGVYLAVTGPTYETNAESRLYRDHFGADAVGMSIAPEVIVARNRGMNCIGISCITNVIGKDGTNATSHEEVEKVMHSPITSKRISKTFERFFQLYASQYQNK